MSAPPVASVADTVAVCTRLMALLISIGGRNSHRSPHRPNRHRRTLRHRRRDVVGFRSADSRRANSALRRRVSSGRRLRAIGPAAFLLYAVVLLILALGLWKRWPWARRATILFAVAGIALAVPAISNAVADSRVFAIVREGVQIIVRVLIVFYLSQEPVKDWFAARP